MIDNEGKALALMDKMVAVLPIRVRVDAETRRSMKRGSPGLEIPGAPEIRELFYLGNYGGIMCRLGLGGEGESGGEPEEVQIISITHLRFGRSLPFWREVDKYQKRRTKRLRMQGGIVY